MPIFAPKISLVRIFLMQIIMDAKKVVKQKCLKQKY